MKIKQNNAYLISSEEVEVIKTHQVEVQIEREDECTTNIMTAWSMFITYRYDQWDSEEVVFENAFVIDNATGKQLHEVSLSDEEYATIKKYISLELNID